MIDKKGVWEFVKKQSLATLATADKKGKPESAVMAIAVTDSNEILMSTEPNTRKMKNLSINPLSSILVGGLDSPSVQLDGETIIASGSMAEGVKNQILAIHPETKDYLSTTSIFLRFVPKWLRYSNPPEVLEINY
ncbi:MAG: pyridoxamine 5'-phosphate oxidase family protein [Patescibacteria group bacterium]